MRFDLVDFTNQLLRGPSLNEPEQRIERDCDSQIADMETDKLYSEMDYQDALRDERRFEPW